MAYTGEQEGKYLPTIAVVSEIPTPYRNPVFDQLSARKDMQFEFFFLSRTQKDRFWNIEEGARKNTHYLPGVQICFPGYHTVYFNSGMKKEILSKKFDAFVLVGYAQLAMARLLRHCWKNHIPYVLITESHLKKKRSSWVRRLKDPYVRRVYSRSSANLVMGSEAKAYVEFYGASSKAVHYFPNTVDGVAYAAQVQHFRKERSQERNKLGLSDGVVILFVGTLNHRKGVDLLLQAMEGVSKESSGVRLLLIGRGNQEAEYRAWVEQHRLGSLVTFLGFIQPSNLPRYYALSDLFVLPSREEPFGAVICEAMSAGLPIVTTDAVGAAKDYVHPGENGLVVPAGDLNSLQDAIRSLVTNKSLREKWGARSQEIMKVWTHDRMVDEFLSAVRVALESNNNFS